MRQFLTNSTIRYLLVGGVIYAIDILFFTGSVSVFGNEYYLAANIAAKTVAAVTGFFLHKHYTFNGEQHHNAHQQFLMYIGLFVFNILLSSVLIFLLIGLLSLSSIPARIAVDVVVTVMAFIVSKKIVFRSRI